MSHFEMFIIWFNLVLLNIYVIYDCLSSIDKPRKRRRKKRKKSDKNEDQAR